MIGKTFPYPELIKKLPTEVLQLFEVFLKDTKLGGDEIRLVGGCVRDMIANLEVKDFDFATKFLPEQVIEILTKNKIHAVPTGIKFGTITAVINKQHFEITTLRKDNQQDGRHCEPEFIDDYFFDAARRDFTMNALYLDNNGLVHDYFDGIGDLKAQKVKFIGEASQRIEEDFLRILRFFRFSCRYSQKLDKQGLEACIKHKNGIKSLSADRIRNEIFKTFAAAKNKNLLWIFEELENSTIRNEIFSTKLQIKNLEKLFNVEDVLKIKFSDHLKFASLIIFQDQGETPIAEDTKKSSQKQNNVIESINLKISEESLQEILLRLNFSNHEKEYFKFLLHTPQALDYQAIRDLLVFAEKDFVRDAYLLNLSQNNFEIFAAKKLLEFIDNFSLPNFPINGDDLIKLNIEGKAIGQLLSQAKKMWINSDFKMQRDELLRFVGQSS